MRIRTIVASLIVGVLGALPATAGAQAIGEVGGPPTNGSPLPFPPPHKKTFDPKATTEAIVIAVGVGPRGRTEIVGQGSKIGLCIDVVQLDAGGSSGRCGPIRLPPVIDIESFSIDHANRRKRTLTEFSGFVQPTAASVIAAAQMRKGKTRRTKTVTAITALPDSTLLSRLGQTTPFGFYVAQFRGCLFGWKLRANAFDSSNGFLGSSGVSLRFPPDSFPHPCGGGSGASTFGIFAGAASRG